MKCDHNQQKQWPDLKQIKYKAVINQNCHLILLTVIWPAEYDPNIGVATLRSFDLTDEPLPEDNFGTRMLTEELTFFNPSAVLSLCFPVFQLFVSTHFFLSFSVPLVKGFGPGVFSYETLWQPWYLTSELIQPCLVAVGIPPGSTPLSRPARLPACLAKWN